MKKYYLAVDIGASSGRHILGSVENGKISLEEIYRFENGITPADGSLAWDIEHLTKEVIAGIAVCKEIGKIPVSVAIDTWGVDYVLLDENDRELLPVYSYRDSRTDGIPEEVDKIIPRDALYRRTGIQPMNFNTVYQLYCEKQSGRIEKAKRCLMMPEYLAYRLTGKKVNEYTSASTTGLLDAETKSWDKDLLKMLGIDPSLFSDPVMPGTLIGTLSPEVLKQVGFDLDVLAAPGHDTASAVAACPIDDESVYLSSGTWSLIGTENRVPVLSPEAANAGFTNEGGVEYRYRFLKNIMGMWLFQNLRKDLNKKFTYDEMMEMAMQSDFHETVDPNHPAFLAPESMLTAVRTVLGKPDLPVADVLSCVYDSLANSYARAIREIEQISGKSVKRLMIVGGGSKDRYLNALSAKVTGKTVMTGLGEATATGNLLSQIMRDEGIDLDRARAIVRNSFDFKEVYA